MSTQAANLYWLDYTVSPPLWTPVSSNFGLPVAISAGRSGTATQSSVASSASSVTILAANTARDGATIYNDSTQILYLLLGTGPASSTVHTVQMAAASYYEVPYGYTGIITGIWASANGSARVTQLTA